MAIVVDGTVATWSLTSGGGNDDPTGTSASFTPADNSLLVVGVANDTTGGTTPTPTISGGGLTWTQQAFRGDAEGTGGVVMLYTAPVVTGASMQVTTLLTNTGQAGSSTRGGAKVWIVTGHDTTTPVNQVGENSTTSNSFSTTAISANANGRLFVVGGDWNALGAPTSSNLANSGSDTGTNPYTATNAFYSWIMGTIAATNGNNVSANLDASGAAAADWNWVQMIVREAAGAGSSDAGWGPLIGLRRNRLV